MSGNSKQKAARKKEIENNPKYRSIEEIVATLENMKPIYKDAFYKQGLDDCIHLLRRSVRKLKL